MQTAYISSTTPAWCLNTTNSRQCLKPGRFGKGVYCSQATWRNKETQAKQREKRRSRSRGSSGSSGGSSSSSGSSSRNPPRAGAYKHSKHQLHRATAVAPGCNTILAAAVVQHGTASGVKLLNRLQSCNRMTACMLYIPCPICCLVDVDANADTETKGHLPLPCPARIGCPCVFMPQKNTSPCATDTTGGGTRHTLNGDRITVLNADRGNFTFVWLDCIKATLHGGCRLGCCPPRSVWFLASI